MSLRNLLNSLKTLLGGTSFKEEETLLAAQHDPEAVLCSQMLDAEAPQEDDFDDEFETFQRLEADLSEGEFACTISGTHCEGWNAEADLDYQEIIEAKTFEQVIAILSERYHCDYSWSVNARDWTGNTYKHRCEAEDNEHDYFCQHDIDPGLCEFACLISRVSDVMVSPEYAGNLVFIQAEEFTEVIAEMSNRLGKDGSWSLQAMDWTGKRFKYEQIERQDVKSAAF
ncbi:hypothetical protein [Pseudovibrio sp. Tun.PSC04-5.I4]|uniref:hypothetical protein n=1 Tax=Pseudovibrio sp. Tun.PSC04-5.I4 TaxID=1798213 RepID=UPI00088184AC|nr:hypothetical protein [Pseudovibrio sp. Tun.PSC04-5.I4]SDR49121.1 hypothetical protein SAMN04515695_6128 [Pseudovibrio sp. Tun.PSC04-5.I4]